MKNLFYTLALILSFHFTVFSQEPINVPMLDQHQILGGTYNIFGLYNDEASIKKTGNIISPGLYTNYSNTLQICSSCTSDGNSVSYNYPNTVKISVINEATTIESFKESISEFEKDLALKATVKGKYGYYSGEAKAKYSTATNQSVENYYSLLQTTYNGYTVSINDVSDTSIYDSTFLNDLKTQNTLDFFNKYGTHIVTAATAGQALKYELYGSKKDFDSSEDFSYSAKVSYNNNVGTNGKISTSGSGSYKDKSSKIETDSEFQILGGNPSTNSVTSNDNFDEWSSTFWDDPIHQIWTDATTKMIPLWELLDTNDPRRSELEDDFNNYFTLYSTGYTESYIKGSSNYNKCEAYVYLMNDYEIPIGFGIKVDKNHVKNLYFKIYNPLADVNTYYYEYSDNVLKKVPTLEKNYDYSINIPNGSAITGIGLGTKKTGDGKTKVNMLNIFYQAIDYNETGQGYLDDAVFKISKGSGSSDKSYHPSDGNSDIIQNIGISVDNDGGITKFVIGHTRLLTKADASDISKVNN